MSLRAPLVLLLLLVGCPSGDPNPANDDDSTEEALPQPAPLAAVSDGACPDWSSPGMGTFSSGGEERVLGTWFPEGDTTDLPVLFFFHGLTTPGTDPVQNLASGLGFQELADELPAIIIAPEAKPTPLPLVGNVLLWGILESGEADLRLYDDLRACAVNELGGDVRRVHAMGFSGGALWTTRVLLDRSDTLASVVEFSGGAELDIPIDGGPFLLYETPTVQTPALLVAGGATDQWPGGGLDLINFPEATGVLQGGLRVDGHFVVRCDHTQGHTIPNDGWRFAQRWVKDYEYGLPGRYEEDGIGDEESWCEVLQ